MFGKNTGTLFYIALAAAPFKARGFIYHILQLKILFKNETQHVASLRYKTYYNCRGLKTRVYQIKTDLPSL